ncbi:MAG TPA: glycolate oxidase subunit GlcE [Steroidobacteraceae bacterium]|jgi:glycolate oxidase FAD binding subunit|nr:glycolate oxidase subunit GlcE [Steroidobacteraceae bacterium]
MSDLQSLQERIRAAAAARQPLRIRGGGSKDFYGGRLEGELLEVRALSGITHCEPTELVISARAGTPLAELARELATHQQMLAFEPSHFGGRATLGGTVASGLSGPRRAYCGALRDFVLGVEIIDGRGELLRFGGRVIKNVAGFDVSRLMAGSLGTLGLLTEITLKTVPCPRAQCTLRFEMDQPAALESMTRWATRPLPISATAWHEGMLSVRLSGAESAVRAAHEALGGELVAAADAYWEEVTEQRLEFFAATRELWRVSLPAHSPALPVAGPAFMEWGGSLRWLQGPLDGSALRALAARFGGHATLYRTPVRPPEGTFQSLSAAMLMVHKRLKAAFDPIRILNRGRLHPDL